ncbi:MAG: fibronectin type III domain-containing protein, partial [Salinivirgaceae bacterium]|nr:fibronectin type III domain-containing protein [Salinivirgaceae bacterium]
MKRSILHIILLLWAMLPATTAHSQSYPVQSNVYVVAPYSQTYSDYYADGQQRMFVNILLNDMSQGHLDVVLRFSIKSNNLKLTSKLTGNVQPITIHSGKMYRVEGSELAQYLRVDDMQAEGRLAGEFQKSGKLPEGYYEIKVEVVEYYRRANVSAPSYSTMWIMQPEAPVWTMPQNNAKIDAISPQFMLFGWMMTGNTSMLRNIKYEFSIYEKPASMSADVVVKTSTPIYREELTQQTLVYGPDKPLLELGKVYACRVKVEDGDGLVSFKNDGYSSTLVFKYGEECDPPTQVTITDITKKGATVNWVSDQSHSGYDVEVRELSDGKSSDWFTWKIDKRQYNYEIKQLSSDSRYECRVAAVCGQRTNGIRSAYTDPVEFKTYAAGNKKYNCGDLVEASKPTNQVPYPYLNEGDLITANGHAFVVESISKASGSVFSGQCLWNIEIWNVNILCDFIDIEVNALGELLRGKIVACHDKAQAKAFTRLQSAAYMPAGTQVPSSYKADKIMAMTETVDSVRIVDGETLIYVAGQNPVKVAATDNVFVRSADGNYYAVEDGKVYPKPSNLDKDGNRTLSYDQLITATFGYDDNLGRHAGVDAYSDAKKPFASQYSQYQLHSNDAYATWIAKSQTAIPIARVTVSGGDRAALQFRNGGQTIAATSAADADALYLPLTADGQYDAYYTTQDTHGADLEVMAGQLNVVSYPQQNINVCLVEVNGASYPRTSNELSNYLNDVFGQAVFGVNLTKTSIEVDKFNGTLSAKESGALSAYNSDMKKLIRKVKKLPDYTDDTYYIMLVAKSDNPALGGFMPVNSNFGFVFAQANSGAGQMNRTIAHELAHG